MPQLIIIVADEQLDEVKRILTERYDASVAQIVYHDWEGPVDLELLKRYYENEYRQTDGVQALIAAGSEPIPADDMSEDDWTEFANSLNIHQPHDGMALFQPTPGNGHDYARWTQSCDEAGDAL